MIDKLEIAIVLALAGSAVRLLRVKLPRGEERSFDTAVTVLTFWYLGLGPALALSVWMSAVEAIGHRLVARRDAASLRGSTFDAARRLLVASIVWATVLVVPRGIEGDGVIAAVLLLGSLHAVLDEASHRVLIAAKPGSRHGSLGGAILPTEPVTSIYVLHILLASAAGRLIDLLGAWGAALPLSILVLLQYGLVMYMRIRLAYSQTIAALSRAIEIALGDVEGSSRALADMAVRVGRRVGLKGGTLQDLNYAALLMRIGRIGLTADAETVVTVGDPSAEAVQRSARVLSSIEFLEGAAAIIGPTVVEGERSEEAAIAAQVLEACALYQEQLSTSAQPARLVVRRILDQVSASERVLRALEQEALGD